MIAAIAPWFLGVRGKPQGFRIYDATSGELLAELGPDDRSIDLSTLGLTEGSWTLAISYVDEWGGESDRVERQIVIDGGGNPMASLLNPTNLRTWPVAGGSVHLNFQAFDLTGVAERPKEYEVAEATDVATILATYDGSRRQYNEELGPFTDGVTVRLRVRASDGQVGGQRGPWIDAPAAVADASPPPTPSAPVQSPPG